VYAPTPLDDYPHLASWLADRLRCAAVEGEALGLPQDMLRAIEEAAEMLEQGREDARWTH
jgi:hypothetical protein